MISPRGWSTEVVGKEDLVVSISKDLQRILHFHNSIERSALFPIAARVHHRVHTHIHPRYTRIRCLHLANGAIRQGANGTRVRVCIGTPKLAHTKEHLRGGPAEMDSFSHMYQAVLYEKRRVCLKPRVVDARIAYVRKRGQLAVDSVQVEVNAACRR
jgi:hypothetical protein